MSAFCKRLTVTMTEHLGAESLTLNWGHRSSCRPRDIKQDASSARFINLLTCGLAKIFVCTSCTALDEDGMEPIENLCNGVETMNKFCYLGDKLIMITSGGCEAAVTARMRIGWIKFRECRELLLGKRFSLKIKARVFQSCVRSTMLCGGETWCWRVRRTKRAIVRAMRGAKLADRKKTEDMMNMLGLNQTIDKMA